MLHSYAQDNILYRDIQQAKNNGDTFEIVSAFTPANRKVPQDQRLQEAFINSQEVHFLQYNKSVLKNLESSITLFIPLD